MKKTLLFLLCIFALTIHAENKTEGFEDVNITNSDQWGRGTELSNGWKIVGGYIANSADNSDYGFWTKAHQGKKSLTAQYGSSNSAFVVIPKKLSGELKFFARKSSTSSSSKGSISIFEVTSEGDTYTKVNVLATKSLTTTWTEYTVDLGSEGKLVAINMIRAGVDDINYNTYSAPTTPVLSLFDEGTQIKNGSKYDFGLIKSDSSHIFTIKNSGEGTLVATATVSNGFSVSKSSFSIDSGNTEDLSVSMLADNPGLKTGILTLSAEANEDINIDFKGIVRDKDKTYLDFDSLPEGWTINSGASLEDGTLALDSKYDYEIGSYVEGELTSPLITIEGNTTLFFRYLKNTTSSWYSPKITVEYSDNGTTWKSMEDGMNYAVDTDATIWKSAYITDIPETTKYLRIRGSYVKIDDLYGLSLSKEALMQVDAADFDFGLVNADTTHIFKVRNAGTLTLNNLKVSTTDSCYIASLPETVEPGESVDLTVTFKTDSIGEHKAIVTVSADGQKDFTFALNGFAADKEAVFLDFDSNTLPDGWENNGWSIENGTISSGYYSSYSPKYIISPSLCIKSGDNLVIRAKKEYADNYGSYYLKVYSSTDDGATWSEMKKFTDEFNDSVFTTMVYSGAPTGTMKIKLEGYYAIIDAMSCYHLNMEAPEMTVRDGENVIIGEKALDLGIIYRDTTYKYTVTNTGTGKLEVTISSSDESQFTVSPSSLALSEGESGDIEVAVVMTPYGKKSADIIIKPSSENLKTVTIQAEAITRDASKWIEDFEAGIPSTWDNYGWGVTSPYNGNSTYMANSSNKAEGTYLITPRLKAKANEILEYEIFVSYDSLTVEYSNDDMRTWNKVDVYNPENAGTIGIHTFTAPSDGYYFLRFTDGGYAYIDNFYGFTYAPDTDPVTVTIDESGYATLFYASKCLNVPEGLEACTYQLHNDALQLSRTYSSEDNAFSVIPKNEPVVLHAVPGTYTFTVNIDDTLNISRDQDNILLGMEHEGMTGSADDSRKFYALTLNSSKESNSIGFYWMEEDGAPFNCKAHKAYMALDPSTSAKGFRLDGTVVTGINHSITNHKEVNAKKMYNISGQRVDSSYKGIIVVDGKKVMQ